MQFCSLRKTEASIFDSGVLVYHYFASIILTAVNSRPIFLHSDEDWVNLWHWYITGMMLQTNMLYTSRQIKGRHM